ncbi:hypothetical protein DFJ64_2859 [Thermasporomyces composti]|jgi:hypothetical protein|uniref:Uncharacterized protein n=2 Tax=Thermasporomyces composti TaxID=696763 RepID=A0A3D9VE88_THECX|nr:hypothetical protein DFJ64_2859 [Thermasporomyces composti]
MAAMTDVRPRPAASSADQPSTPPTSRPAAVGAVLAAGWAGLVGALPCAALAVIGWLAASGGSFAGALRVGLDAWLLAHRVPIDLGNGRFDLVPLGLSLVPVLLLYRAGAWAGRSSSAAGELLAGVLALAATYGGFATVVAVVAGTDGATPAPTIAFGHAAALATVVGSAGFLRSSGRATAWWRACPEWLRAALHGGLTGFLASLTGGVLLVAGVLLAHIGQVADVTKALAPGPVGVVLLLVLSLAYLPNAALYALAFALGPGFAMGTATVVSPSGVVLGPMPAFPLLAALPSEGEPPVWSVALLGVPILAGMAAGVATTRRFPNFALDAAVLRGVLAGMVTGLACTGCVALARGSGGPGRLVEVGPSVLGVGVVAVSTFAIASASGVLLLGAWIWGRARLSAAWSRRVRGAR